MESIKPIAIYMCLGLLAIHTWIIFFRSYLPLKKHQPFILANFNGVPDVRAKKIAFFAKYKKFTIRLKDEERIFNFP
ncbi:hypothetical protein OUZ56_011612 [Daphnia magna]|uniref:Uncharacterized protein n=1 Tax=Daphnia magna TaxID=35525 RepID=A0ABQ9Z0V1_9CRUS|nr:hypothetical protein OUZ56_011612 [Daphnia magna]